MTRNGKGSVQRPAAKRVNFGEGWDHTYQKDRCGKCHQLYGDHTLGCGTPGARRLREGFRDLGEMALRTVNSMNKARTSGFSKPRAGKLTMHTILLNLEEMREVALPTQEQLAGALEILNEVADRARDP